MKKIIFLAMVFTYNQASTTTKECIKLTKEATAIHWAYMNGQGSLKKSIKATTQMEKACKKG